VRCTSQTSTSIEAQLLKRNQVFEEFFARQVPSLATACRAMSERFLQGGRLLAFGRGPYSTDAQHVSVEFVHPVIVGKRALPALDLSILVEPSIRALAQPVDIAMGFGPPEGDPNITAALASARSRGTMTFALPGTEGDYAISGFTSDAFIHQEAIEILYHTLWETVHVFFERREVESEAGNAGFLYPFLGQQAQSGDVLADVAASIRMKVVEDAKLRERVAAEQTDRIAGVAVAMRNAIENGGKLILFGNGGSATDANDWAIDCLCPPHGLRAVPAVSLSSEPAILTALANDVGPDVIFLRQLIAQARPADVVVGISTSGGSRNVILALEEARRQKITTVALLGYDGGEIVRRSLADFALVVPSDYIPRIQEVQASIYHVLRETLETAHA
jgi:D-sedoheptulose 7-phosphate isomerase